MVDIGHLRCPGLDRVGSTPANRIINPVIYNVNNGVIYYIILGGGPNVGN